jgi:hypothetical protein
MRQVVNPGTGKITKATENAEKQVIDGISKKPKEEKKTNVLQAPKLPPKANPKSAIKRVPSQEVMEQVAEHASDEETDKIPGEDDDIDLYGNRK